MSPIFNNFRWRTQFVVLFVLSTLMVRRCPAQQAAFGVVEDQSRSLPARWKQLELDEFGRLVHWLRKDEKEARRQVTELKSSRKRLVAFFNGHSSTSTRAAAKSAMTSLEQTPVLQSVFLRTVPPMSRDQFSVTSDVKKIVQSDDSLAPPPPVLLPNESSDAVARAKASFDAAWKDLVRCVRSGEPVTIAQIDRLRQRLSNWDAAAGQNMEQVSPTTRFRAHKYIQSVAQIISTFENPQKHATATTTLFGTEVEFNGGTLADLIHHVLANELSVKVGSQAQVMMSEVGHDMTRELDTLIAVAEYRIERYKAQNASHNAALKGRMVGWNYSGGNAGLGSTAYGGPLPGRSNVAGNDVPISSLERLQEMVAKGSPLVASIARTNSDRR